MLLVVNILKAKQAYAKEERHERFGLSITNRLTQALIKATYLSTYPFAAGLKGVV